MSKIRATPGGSMLPTASVQPPTSSSGNFRDYSNSWLTFGLYVVGSILSSGAVLCSGWCTIKFVRNGCHCKVRNFCIEPNIIQPEFFFYRLLGSSLRADQSMSSEVWRERVSFPSIEKRFFDLFLISVQKSNMLGDNKRTNELVSLSPASSM